MPSNNDDDLVNQAFTTTSRQVQQKLARSMSLTVRCALAQNPALDDDVIDTLLARGSQMVNTFLAARSNLAPSLMHALVALDNTATLERLAARPDLPEAVAYELIASSDLDVFDALANNTSLSSAVFVRLVDEFVNLDYPDDSDDDDAREVFDESAQTVLRTLKRNSAISPDLLSAL